MSLLAGSGGGTGLIAKIRIARQVVGSERRHRRSNSVGCRVLKKAIFQLDLQQVGVRWVIVHVILNVSR